MNRRNTEDSEGRRWYVVADGRTIAGPFGSESYADDVAERMADRWSNPTSTSR